MLVFGRVVGGVGLRGHKGRAMGKWRVVFVSVCVWLGGGGLVR